MAILELPLETAAPVPPAQSEVPIEGNWLAKEGDGPIPTAFPDLKADKPLDLKKTCPRLFGDNELKIEPTDDTCRRLLKAQIEQGVQFIQLWRL